MEDNVDEQTIPKLDKWQLLLDEPLRKLKECQLSCNIDSCLKCDKILECDIKDTYVSAVYESMNKDSDGGFEF